MGRCVENDPVLGKMGSSPIAVFVNPNLRKGKERSQRTAVAFVEETAEMFPLE
jgi:hypothetical protein